MSTHDPFRGVYPMMYAFFDEAGHLDRAAMRRQVAAAIASNCHGVAVLGLATEVSKLTEAERRTLLDWVVEDLGGRLPLAVTVYGNSVEQQALFVRAAQDAGADWVILQPPPVKGLPEMEYVRFFGAVAERTDLPVAIQNAPEYIGIGLSPDGLNALRRNHPNFTLLKGESSAITIQRVIDETRGELTVFNGRGGLELPDVLRAGCAGMIPALDTGDVQVRIYEAMRSGGEQDQANAEQLYREILPAIVFIMQGIDTLLCYGKRVLAYRLGYDTVHDRAPALPPTDYGLDCARRYARCLGPLPE